MSGLMKAEFYKFRKEPSLWIITAVLVACASISIFTGVYDSVENAVLNLGKDFMILVLAGAIYSGLTLTDEFANRTIIHAVAYGCRRSHILLAKGCRYLLGCSLIVVLYLTGSVLLSAAVLESEGAVFKILADLALKLCLTLPLYWGVYMVFFFIAMTVRKSGTAMGISVALSIIGVVFTNKAYSSVPDAAGSLLRFLPAVQISGAFDGASTAGDYWISAFFSIVLMALCFAGSLAVIKKAEL